ncbi:hypothetical protein ScPMuIL_003028 [Solemya velum]
MGIGEADDMARTLALKWLYSNHMGWKRTHHMFEKYSVKEPGSRGVVGNIMFRKGLVGPMGWSLTSSVGLVPTCH